MSRQGSIDFGGSSRITNLPPAVSSGQPLIFEQLGAPPEDPYSGGLYATVGPSSSAAFFMQGVMAFAIGTVSTPNLTTASLRDTIRRTAVTSAATAGSLAGIRSSHLLVWRGNAANRGGFRYTHEFALSTAVVGQRGFIGLQDTTSAPTNVDPLTSITGNKIGVGFNAETGNWKLIHNTAGTTPTVVDLTADFPINTIDVLKLELKCLQNASTVDWKLTKRDSSAMQSGTLSTNIPSSTVFMSPYMWMCNNATAAACALNQTWWVLTSKNG